MDTTGRVQVFSYEGTFRRAWQLPAWDNGTPTAVTFSNGGTVLIPDTHYSRILEYTPEGELLDQWGAYGTGTDQFIYPTGIQQDADGDYYVSEYGVDAERVHVFDRDYTFLRQWGQLGDEPADFNRSMAIALTHDGRVAIVDTGNHRIQLFEKSGELVRVIGREGPPEEQLDYPYDLDVAPDGTILAAEYGHHRVSRYTTGGEFVGAWGTPGRGDGELNGPRGVAASEDGFVFITDTDNHRMVRVALEDVA